jgi:hypothetical protein
MTSHVPNQRTPLGIRFCQFPPKIQMVTAGRTLLLTDGWQMVMVNGDPGIILKLNSMIRLAANCGAFSFYILARMRTLTHLLCILNEASVTLTRLLAIWKERPLSHRVRNTRLLSGKSLFMHLSKGILRIRFST